MRLLVDLFELRALPGGDSGLGRDERNAAEFEDDRERSAASSSPNLDRFIRGQAMRHLAIGLGILAAMMIGAAEDSSINSLGMALVRVPAGSFEMGADSTPLAKDLITGVSGVVYDRTSADGDYDERPVHKVTLTQPFWISASEVTVEQFRQFRPEYRGSSYFAPYVSGVNWYDAAAFCEWLSKREGKTYRLPTEAEWEYSARREPTLPGLKNMHGGVAEWVADWHGLYPRASQTDPVGPASGIAKVVRGGGLDYHQSKSDGGKRLPAEMAYYARSTNRAGIAPSFASANGNIGFRVVQAEFPRTAPLSYRRPFFQEAVTQDHPDLKAGPDPAKP